MDLAILDPLVLDKTGRPGTAGHALEFADGSVARADLVVGADGAWSMFPRGAQSADDHVL